MRTGAPGRGLKRRQVALLVESSRAYGRGVLLGVAGFVRERQNWSVRCEEWTWSEALPGWLADWKGDGIIARIETPELAAALKRLGTPVVDVRGSVAGLEIPLIDTDDRRVAQLAAEHLMERGFRHYAYCGFVGANYSDKRSRWFQECLGRAGFEARIYSPAEPLSRGQTLEHERRGLLFEEDLSRWLMGLPKPVGVMACNDIRGQQVLNLCRRLGLLAPDDVAVAGVDNDEVLCELSDPPLSSVAPDTRRIGYEAAAMLDRMMEGGRAPAPAPLIEPLGIVTRRSTDVLAIPDRAVASALRFIRDHACQGARVAEVARAASLSRSVLERRFARLVGRSPKTEVLRVQLDRARQLLASSDLPLPAIAERCGFKHPEYFSTLFKLKTGLTPGQFRRGAR